MSNNRINFTVEPGSDIFDVKIKFSDNEQITFSTKKHDHISNQSYGNYINNVLSSGGCVDVQPINGVYQKRFIKNLFKTKNIKDMDGQLKYLKDHEQIKFVKVFVLDIKDTKCHYDSISDIQKAEKEVEVFFSGKEPKELSPRKDIHKLVKENNINYFFCEGRLKSYLINNVFSSSQSDLFQNTDEGKATLCQISEVLLNAFKVGYEISVSVNDKLHTLSPEDYLILFQNKQKLDPSKNTVTISPISLFTLYPEHYKELYSIKEKYCESLSHAFKVDHNYDEETHTTAIGLRL